MSRYNVWFAVVMGACCNNGGVIAASGYTPRDFYTHRENLAGFGFFTERQVENARNISLSDTEEVYEKHSLQGIESTNYSDPWFPQRLLGIANAPLVLFYKGEIELLNSRRTVGIIGSRRCNGEGEKACRIIAADVAAMGGVVISGLAQGIDTISHKACVEAGGKTVAFTGVPMDEYFPRANADFQHRLEEEHLVVSEYHSGYRYYSANFIQRNRLIAAAADAVCVVQAKNKSGSLATVNRAIEYDKPVFTVPGSIFSPAYRGSNGLLIKGLAMAVADGKTIMEYLGATDVPQITEETVSVVDYDLSDSAKTVLDALDGAMFSAQLAKACGLPAGVVKASLTELEMYSLIEKTASGEYIRLK
ncbi:MAG: DNA-protecting protein DprA [Oscillospiraceae bacterium]|nr:DNA-protecting protein DprA [Oscillospiraceae bacterium]